MATGTVYLVGAGPGDPELLTVRAAKLLATAEAVVYDRLVPESIVSLAPPQAELFNVGKASGSHPVPQDSINSLLLRLAGEGKRVVRLKGGDPFVFGRGGEEAAFLARHDVPCIVVPGVTTAIAAPAAAGIPVTCRGVASTLAVASGHPTAEGDEPDWPALARIDTVVFMMGAANLERIAEKLVAAGRSPETPAALVSAAYWPQQSAVFATLGTIAAEANRAGATLPATLVVGEVVNLARRPVPEGCIREPGL